MDQLLTHNFLDLLGDEVSFWHSSFRDFFAARLVAELTTEQILELVTSSDWALVTSFLSGLLPDSRPLRETLVEASLKGETLDETYWPIETLGLMGNDTTTDILRAISEPSFIPVHALAGNILRNRRFEGAQIFDYVFGLLWMMDDVSMGDIDPDEVDEWMPGFTQMDIDALRSFYKKIMLALSKGNIDNAQRYEKRLTNYLESLTESERKLDQRLLSKGVDTLNDFRYELNLGHFSEEELLDFCRNTLLESSLPFLETVFLSTEAPRLRTEARLAIQSIARGRIASVVTRDFGSRITTA